MHSISSDLPEGERRGAGATDTLATDYREVFRSVSGQRVLADLATYSRFYTVFEDEVPSDVLRVDLGRRQLFNRILRFMNMTPDEVRALEMAARMERLTNKAEGEI